jgi:hypothetical protein
MIVEDGQEDRSRLSMKGKSHSRSTEIKTYTTPVNAKLKANSLI